MATLLLCPTLLLAAPPAEFSGLYPHLATFNDELECGTGAVVPWAGRLWVVSYGPHLPRGSSDKLYEIAPDLSVTVRAESIGGTPANRLVHRESSQLFIGPYCIDGEGRVRVIPYDRMPGRHTATLRHLTDPANKVYYATMEEGFYEVDVHSLAVTELYADTNEPGGRRVAGLPGYHGKGAYTAQGRVVYANNGEPIAEARRRPDIASGCLAEWLGGEWRVVRRNQFCEVTGPGGIQGAERDDDPLWSIGWDHRSLILMLLDGGRWQAFRLPKASHCYDGAHGWNTEWPRIRDIGETDLLMTMHGCFWRFPRGFGAGRTAGIRPRSTYLKIMGDFCRWGDGLVFGCDDAARSEFLNARGAKGGAAGPGQSQSNLWFVAPETLDGLGPSVGQGAVWRNDPVAAGAPSDPYLFAGYAHRGVHLAHDAAEPVTFRFEVDLGDGAWHPAETVTVPAAGYRWHGFEPAAPGEWIRVTTNRDCTATVLFTGAADDERGDDSIFAGLARAGDSRHTGGLVRARGDNLRTLHLAATDHDGDLVRDVGYYEMGAESRLRRVDDPTAHAWLKEQVAIPTGVLAVDAASVLYVDDAGARWRLPKGDPAIDALCGRGLYRIDREVVTERDIFHAHGTFYELPAENAGGFAKIRPICTHNRRIVDYASYRGMLVLTGIAGGEGNPHIVRSDDGRAAVWLGAIDDLWRLGKPVGRGGPWHEARAEPFTPSDPYLMHGHDRKRLTARHDAAQPVTLTIEVDLTGDADWQPYAALAMPPATTIHHDFAPAFRAHWVRVMVDRGCGVTVELDYQ